MTILIPSGDGSCGCPTTLCARSKSGGDKVMPLAAGACRRGAPPEKTVACCRE